MRGFFSLLVRLLHFPFELISSHLRIDGPRVTRYSVKLCTVRFYALCFARSSFIALSFDKTSQVSKFFGVCVCVYVCMYVFMLVCQNVEWVSKAASG